MRHVSLVRPSRRGFLGGVGAVGTAALLGAVRPLRATAAPVVRIGFLDAASGVFADNGAHHLAGVRFALDEANRKGGVRFELVQGDDTSKPAAGATEARRLIGQEKVDAIIQGTSSAVALALGPIAREAGVFCVYVGGQDTSLTGDHANRVAFRFSPDIQMLSRAVAPRALALGKKWYFLQADFAQGKDGYARFSQFLRDGGGSEIGHDTLPVGTADFSSTMTKIRNSDADVVVLVQGGLDVANAARAFVALGLNKKMKLVGPNLEDFYAAALPLNELAGSVFGIVWAPTVSPSAEAFARRLRAAIPGPVSNRHWLGYTVASQMIDRMHAAGTTRAEALVGAFSDHAFDVAKANPATWRGCDHQCAQDTYAAEIVDRATYEKTGYMYRVVSTTPSDTSAAACATPDARAAAALISAQRIPERDGYEAKRL